MYFNSFDDEILIEILQGWLDEDGEVFIDIYIPKSGSGTSRSVIKSIDAYKESSIDKLRSGSTVEILKASLYPMEGIIDDAFIKMVMGKTVEGSWYEMHLMDSDEYGRCVVEEIGSLNDMRFYLEENHDTRVRIGPFVHVPSKFEEIAAMEIIISFDIG